MPETIEHLRGPWTAVVSQRGDVLEGPDPFASLDLGDDVDMSIRRGSALPDVDGAIPGTCRTGDIIRLWEGVYVEDGDPSTDAPARWVQAQAMADGLNAAWRAAEAAAEAVRSGV